MTTADSPLGQFLRIIAFFVLAGLGTGLAPLPALAAPEALYLMDARTGETMYESNAETRLHPASLTKMLTLYIAFEEIERGNLTLDTLITVSKNATAQPPSKLGLKAGQKIQLRYLIRAAAIKSANDAAQAIGDAIGGSQAEFAARMTRTARALGMRNSTFKNASGLTAKGHLSTARDMSILGRHLFYDFPQYYNIFSRRETDAGLADVANTNRKFLDAYKGADGIKTGFTQPAGFNLTASAERGGVRLIATVFGGTSTSDRNAKVTRLLDSGFAMAHGGVTAVPPPPPQYQNTDDELVASALLDDGLPEGGEGSSAKTVRAILTLTTSPRPMARPNFSAMATEAEVLVAEMADGIAGALAEAAGTAPTDAQALPFTVAKPEDVTLAAALGASENGGTDSPPGSSADSAVIARTEDAPASAPQVTQTAVAALTFVDVPPNTPGAPDVQTASAPAIAALVPKRQAPIYDEQAILAKVDGEAITAAQPAKAEVITRVSTSGGKHWGVHIGRFASSDAAERILLKTQLVESATLSDSLRKVTRKGGGYDANFLGLSEQSAALACRRLSARSIPCITLGP